MTVFRTSQRGTTLMGFIVGLVVGLGIAAGVALFITKAPIPFINKVGHAPDQPVMESGKLPDPNKSLYSKEPTQTTETSAPAANSNETHPVAATPVGPQTAKSPSESVPVIDRSRTDIPDGQTSFVQAGAYKSADDAENMKGKLALLGFEATVSSLERDGNTVYRVRLGPYNRVDDLNRVRQRLTENGIDASVVSGGRTTP